MSAHCHSTHPRAHGRVLSFRQRSSSFVAARCLLPHPFHILSPMPHSSPDRDDSDSDAFSGIRAPLLANAASSSPSHGINIVQPCCLLDTPPPVRSLVLDYMDDHTAIRYLSTSQMLHAGYHEYPVKQAMSVATFEALPQLNVHKRYVRHVFLFQALYVCLLVVIFPVVWHLSSLHLARVIIGFVSALAFIMPCLFVRAYVARRAECCGKAVRLRNWRGWRMMPRVTRLQEELCDLRLLPYLQHLTELDVRSYEHIAICKRPPLPRTLHTLRLYDSPFLTLEPDTLPPRLTSLSLGYIRNQTLPAGVLPQSLTFLHLTSGFDSGSAIGVGVLPVSLQQLWLYEWTQPLSHIALPASLTELDILNLADYPLPALPPQLEVLAIGGSFNQPLKHVVPSTLRVLSLQGEWDQPLANVLARTPQLEELHLSDEVPFHELAASVLPHKLRVLRLGKRHSLLIPQPSDKPPQLHRVIVSNWDEEPAMALRQLGQSHGFTVTAQFLIEGDWFECELDDIVRENEQGAG